MVIGTGEAEGPASLFNVVLWWLELLERSQSAALLDVGGQWCKLVLDVYDEERIDIDISIRHLLLTVPGSIFKINSTQLFPQVKGRRFVSSTRILKCACVSGVSYNQSEPALGKKYSTSQHQLGLLCYMYLGQHL